ncbi:MAG TPA: acyltransferase family protein, partial [Azospira sp.]|nr:acyltransferase family protein [Azospira sp.]
MSAADNRMPLIDALKGVAAQIILLHHLVSYGPLSKAANAMAPVTAGFLFDYGRMVVQVFLVIGGYLAARALLGSSALSTIPPGRLIWRRYVRLVIPFAAAMVIAILGAAMARLWLADDAIPAAPTFTQVLAHVLLLHGVIDVPALSAGVWYVAIDLQLYALLTLLLWVGMRFGERAAVALVAVTAMAALFHFNRNAELDAWAIYFFASYGMGALVWWGCARGNALRWLPLLAGITVLALALDFRLRIALALFVALLLALVTLRPQLRIPDSALLAWLGRTSYSVFLVHFPVCLVANAFYARFTD